MQILYTSLHYPLPVANGGTMRLWAMLRAIASLGHEITLVCFCKPGEVRGTEAQLREVCRDNGLVEMQFTRMAEGSAYLNRLLAIFSPAPFKFARFRSPEMRECLQRKLREQVFDLVICDSASASINLPKTTVPVVMNSHDLEHKMLQRYVQHEPNPAKKLYAWVEAMKARRFEANAFGRASLGMACSRDDSAVLRKLCAGLRVSVVPNVVDVNDYKIAHDEDPHTMVYVGVMDWLPNCDALEYFVSAILPLIQRQIPEVRLIAAGRSPSAVFRAKFSHIPAVQFTGTLPDLRPVVATAAVSVIPLRIGTGTRLKILEGGAMGKAMVSTTIGAEGLDFVPGREILIADTPREFADGVVELLRDPVRRRSLGQAARRRVAADYDLIALERSIEHALSTLKESIDIRGEDRQAVSARTTSEN